MHTPLSKPTPKIEGPKDPEGRLGQALREMCTSTSAVSCVTVEQILMRLNKGETITRAMAAQILVELDAPFKELLQARENLSYAVDQHEAQPTVYHASPERTINWGDGDGDPENPGT